MRCNAYKWRASDTSETSWNWQTSRLQQATRFCDLVYFKVSSLIACLWHSQSLSSNKK